MNRPVLRPIVAVVGMHLDRVHRAGKPTHCDAEAQLDARQNQSNAAVASVSVPAEALRFIARCLDTGNVAPLDADLLAPGEDRMAGQLGTVVADHHARQTIKHRRLQHRKLAGYLSPSSFSLGSYGR